MTDKEHYLCIARKQISIYDDMIHISNRYNDSHSAMINQALKRGYLCCLYELGLIDDISYDLQVIDHVNVEPEGGEENE